MVWVCYSSSSTCIAFVVALLRLLLFAVLCHWLHWWHKTTPRVVLSPPRGWFYSPKGVGVSPQRGGFIPLKSGHQPTRGGFKGGFIPPHLEVFMPGTTNLSAPTNPHFH